MGVLNEAKERLTIMQVGAALGLEGLKVGLNRSPFREDKKPSFSVFAGGRAFKDQADDAQKGDVWNFVTLAMPSWSSKEVAVFLIELAGLDPKADGFSKSHFKEFKRRKRDAEYRAASAALLDVGQFPKPQVWPDVVAERWSAGVEPRDGRERLADGRGWPVEWADWLLEMGKIAWPAQAWSDRKALAFCVEFPVAGKTPGQLGLQRGGYHQRWIHKRGEQRVKDWLFYPSVPRSNSGLSGFQQELARLQRTVSPFPFVLGSLDRPRNVIITEGQWDAATVYGAAGWFNDSADDPNTAVFGLRGAHSIEVFLAFYGRWIRALKPNVLLLPDNDAAGRSWTATDTSNRIIPKPCFADRLRAWGAARLFSNRIAPEIGKDFNDYWEAKHPDPAAVMDWLIGCGLEF